MSFETAPSSADQPRCNADSRRTPFNDQMKFLWKVSNDNECRSHPTWNFHSCTIRRPIAPVPPETKIFICESPGGVWHDSAVSSWAGRNGRCSREGIVRGNPDA